MSIIKNLMAMGITVGLADRESFVKKASEVIQQYQNNPDQADKMAEGLAKYLEDLKEQLWLQNSISASIADSNVAKEQDVNKLTKAIEELTAEMRRQKG